MYNKKESAVSPVVAVVLLLGIVGVIVAMAGAAVFGNIDNILINDVKKVDVAVQISVTNTDTGSGGTELESKVIITPLSGKDLEFLEYYEVYLLGENVENKYTSVGPVKLDIPKGYNPEITQVVIIGHFTDGEDAVIFTGKIDDGYVISTGGTAKGTATPIGPDVVVTSTPKHAVYRVFYNLNGGSGDFETYYEYVPNIADYNSEINGYEYHVKLPGEGTLTNGDLSFNGWREISNPDKLYTYPYEDTGSENIFIITDKTPEDIRFNAEWVSEFTITFIKDGEVIGTGQTVNKMVVPPTDISISVGGNCLDGWYTDSGFTNKWDMGSKVKVNMYLYAQEYYPYFRYGSHYTDVAALITAINDWKKGTIKEDGTICKDIPLEGEAITINGELSLMGGNLISTTDHELGYPAITDTDIKPHIWASPKWDNDKPLIKLEGGTLNIDGNLVIDGCGRMKDSVITVASSSTLNVNGGSSLKICNGYGEDSSNNNRPYTRSGGGIYSEGTITTIGTGKIIVTNCKSYYRGGGIYVGGGTVNIKCSISKCYSSFGGGLGIYSASGTIKDGSEFTDNHAYQYIKDGETDYKFGAQGGGIYMYSNIILGESTDGDQIKISENTADSSGGGIQIVWSNPEINGKVIVENNKVFCDKGTGNDVRYGGGGIYIEGYKPRVNGLLTVKNCKSSGKSDSGVEKGNGGGIFVMGFAKLFVSPNGNVEISGNTAENNGGGIYNDYYDNSHIGTITLDSGGILTVSGNTAGNNGGGIYNEGTIDNYGTLTVSNNGKGDSKGNYKTIKGGGIYNTGTITVDGELTVQYNAATTNGGGICNAGGTITNSYSDQIHLVNNEAYNGGGIWSSTAKTTGTEEIYYYKINVVASGNTATNQGGGVYNSGGCVIINGKISGNTAGSGGGIYSYSAVAERTVIINCDKLSDNTATNKGGGIYTGYQSDISGKVEDNTAPSGGGIYNTGSMKAISLTVSNNGKGDSKGNYKTIYGGGIYNTGTVKLGNIDLVNNINGNSATTQGGGIWSSSNDNVYYGETKVSGLTGGDIKKWFQNKVDSTTPNTAPKGKNYYYPGIKSEFFVLGSDSGNINTLAKNINEWASENIDGMEGKNIINPSSNDGWIGINNGNFKIIIDEAPIILSSSPSIQGGSLTLESAPGYTGPLLDISGGVDIKIETDITVDGCNVERTRPLVIIGNGATLNINNKQNSQSPSRFTVKNGNNNGDGGDTNKGYGGGIYNTGNIKVNKGILDVNNNKAINGGGIYNGYNYDNKKLFIGAITVSSECTLTVSGNTAENNGGGIYIDNSKITVFSGGTLTVSGNVATDGGGIFKDGGSISGNYRIKYSNNSPNNTN